MSDLTAILLALARKHHLRDAWRILVEHGFTDDEANELIAEADREITNYIKSWAQRIRRTKGA